MSKKLLSLTLVYSGALVTLGLIGYLITGQQNVTALIPAIFGVVVLVVMLILRVSVRPTIAGWVLIALAVVGVLATLGGVAPAVQLALGSEIARPAAVVSKAAMALISVVVTLVCLLTVRRGSAQSLVAQ